MITGLGERTSVEVGIKVEVGVGRIAGSDKTTGGVVFGISLKTAVTVIRTEATITSQVIIFSTSLFYRNAKMNQ